MIPFRLRYRFNRKQILVVRHIFSENKMNEQGYRVGELYTGKDKGIYGKLYCPEGTGKKPLLIFSHELFCTHTTGEDYGRLLAPYGIALYTFDFRNGSHRGKSGNDMMKMSVKTEYEDLAEILDDAEDWEWVDRERIFLAGASQGGFVSGMLAIDMQERIAGLIGLYPAFLLHDVIHRTFQEDRTRIEDINSYSPWFTGGRCYAEDIWDYDIYERMNGFAKPVLLIHGDRDPLVDFRWSVRASQSFPDARLEVIHGSGHGFSGDALKKACLLIKEMIER